MAREQADRGSARGVRWLEEAMQDIRFGGRMLRRNPGFAVVAVLTLALGIGANTAIFSAVNAVILRPLPFADPDELYMLWEENPEYGWVQQTAAPANMLDWREQVPSFDDVAGYLEFANPTVVAVDGATHVFNLSVVTGNFHSVLGVRPEAGRSFTWDETWASGEDVVMLAHGAAVRLYGSASAAVDRRLDVEGVPYRVVGVMPASFAFPSDDADGWLPTAWSVGSRGEVWFRRAHFVRGIARLTDGASPNAAAAQLEAVVGRLQTQYPETNRVMGAGMTPLHGFLTGSTRTPLLVLLSAVGVLLLLGCANVTNLLLVRASVRQREISVRTALGARRVRLVRQMITESLVLAAAAGVVGLAIGLAGTRVLATLAPPELLATRSIPVDMRVVAFTILITTLAGVFFGLVPSLWSLRERFSALRDGGRAGTSRSMRRSSNALVVAEVAAASLLVIGAGLLVRSFYQLQQVDPGFEAEGVVALSINPPAVRYDTLPEVLGFWRELTQRVDALPGIARAGAVSQLPIVGGSWTSQMSVAGRDADARIPEITHREIVPGYFEAMRVPLLAGRTFTYDDDADAPAVVIINQTLAERHFKGEDPIGQRITFSSTPSNASGWRTIVGVVGSERQDGMAIEPRIEIFEPLPQEPRSAMNLVVRAASGDAAGIVPAIRTALADIDPAIEPYEIVTMQEIEADSVARQRFLMILLLSFALIALVLAVVGVYGVSAQTVRQRTHEIGIRIALGARPAQVRAMIARQGIALVLIGLAAGLLAGLVAARAATALLYGVQPHDPLTLAGVALILAGAGVAASYLPALRASRADPGQALRAE